MVGRKAYQYMDRRGFRIARFLAEPPLEKIDYRNAAVMARMLTQSFRSGDYADVWILSTRFESMVKFVPVIAPFLPVSGASIAGEGGERIPAGVILEPDAGYLVAKPNGRSGHPKQLCVGGHGERVLLKLKPERETRVVLEQTEVEFCYEAFPTITELERRGDEPFRQHSLCEAQVIQHLERGRVKR